MGSSKTLPLKFLLVTLIVSLLGLKEVKALSLYGGPSYSFAGVIAESEFYNGATDWAPGLFIGMQYGRLGIEGFFKKFELLDDTTSGGVVYDMKIDNLVSGLGFRVGIHPNVDFILGMNMQSVKATATSSSNTRLEGLLDQDFMSWYVGGGFKGEVYPNFIARIDMAYYKGDIEFGLFGIDFSLMYRFATF